MNKEQTEDLFKGLLLDTIINITKPFKLEEPVTKKAAGIEVIKEKVAVFGIHKLAEHIKVEDLKRLSEDLKLKDHDKSSKNALIKKLTERVVTEGLDKLFRGVKKENLETILDSLGVEKESTVNALASQVGDEVRRIGVGLVLGKAELPLLRTICEELRVEVNANASRAILLEAIIEGETPETRVKSTPKVPKKKPDLVKGVTVEGVVAHYGKPELEEFLKENKITAHGKKRELAKAIVEYLGGDEDAEKDEEKEKEKEKPKEEKPKKESKKATKTKDADKKDSKAAKGKKDKPAKEKEEDKKDEAEEEEDTDKKTTKTPASPKKTPEKRKAEETKSSPKPAKKTKKDDSEKEKPLKDFVFVIAGKFDDQSHAQLTTLIKKQGGKVEASISSKATHLLVPDTTADNAKIQKAKEAKLKIVGLDAIKV